MNPAELFDIFGTEMLLAVLGLLLIVIDLLAGGGKLTGPSEKVRFATYLGLGLILVHAFTLEPIGDGQFGQLDAFALFFKRFFVFTALLIMWLAAPYEVRFPAGRAEFAMLIVFSTLGMCLLASCNDFATLFVGLELVTITLFMLAAFRPGLPRSIESGIKFVIIGAVAAAFMVYGIAFIYGSTGSFDFAEVRAVIEGSESMPGALTFGLLMLLVGLGFKLGAVPFHVWIPDVYQGAPTPVTAMLSVGSKATGVVLMMRLVYSILGDAAGHWTSLLMGLAFLTLLMGNLGAIPQTDMKRFLGYSGIAHAGFLLLALATGSPDSASAILFYMATYLFANVAAFLVVIVVSRTADNSHMDRINGLADRSPFLALVLTVSMLSLAGVPPFAGFFAKFMILRAAIARAELLPVVILSLVMVVVGLYYYLCVVKRIYMREAVDGSVLEMSGWTRGLLLLCVVAMFLFGIYQAPLVDVARAGVASLF